MSRAAAGRRNVSSWVLAGGLLTAAAAALPGAALGQDAAADEGAPDPDAAGSADGEATPPGDGEAAAAEREEATARGDGESSSVEEDEAGAPGNGEPAPSDGDDGAEDGSDEGSDDEPAGAVWLGPGSAPPPSGDEALPEDDFELILPPLLLRRQGSVSTTAFFPLFYSKQSPEQQEIVVGPYYLRRGDVDADVLFPIFWNVRGEDRFTLAIPPFYYHQEGGKTVHGLAPLYFVGRFGAERYTLIPPLLIFTWRNADAAFTLATLYWRRREREQVRAGFFPLVWHGHDPFGSHDVVFPFFFRFRTEEEDKTVTVIPPVYLRERPDRSDWGIAPLLFHGESNDGDYWTIPPLLFHYERFGEDMKLVTPLFGYVEDEGGSTFISWLYQNHRGDTRLDSVAPLFFWNRDTRDGSSTLMVTPLFWHVENPASYTTLFFPLFGRSGTRGVDRLWVTPLAGRYENEQEDTAVTWVFPTFQTRREPDTFIFNIHPLLYVKRAPDQNHVVLPPLFVDLERPQQSERRTVAFPIFWRWEDDGEITQLALNTYYRRYREDGEMGWEFHFFPLVSFGKPNPRDHWWQILYGLVGYRRQGAYAQTQLLYIPFQTDGPD